jgi:hypothetical protein
MKAHLIFIDGGNIPQVVHATHEAAMAEATRLAKKFPEKEIMLLRVAKRLKFENGELVSLGSHVPPVTITTNQLVRTKHFREEKPKIENKTTTLKLPKK